VILEEKSEVMEGIGSGMVSADVKDHKRLRVSVLAKWKLRVPATSKVFKLRVVVRKVLGLDHRWQHLWQDMFFLSWYICHKHPCEIASDSIK